MKYKKHNLYRSIFSLSIAIGLISTMLVSCNSNVDRENNQRSTTSTTRTKIEAGRSNVRVENNQTTKIGGNDRDTQVNDRTSITTDDDGETKIETSTEKQNSEATKRLDRK
jgi:hypothetical protein